MTMLKLAALDADDLTVISACMQDSVIKTGEIAYLLQKKTSCASGKPVCLGKKRRKACHSRTSAFGIAF